MKKEKIKTKIMPSKIVENKILLIIDKKVILDRDLAELYDVETRVLNQAVRRNIERFPEDFMFQLTKEEMENWKSQFVTSNREKMGLRKKPMVFTEPGVAMLSSVLNSKKAIQVNIQIIRTFIKLREILSTHIELKRKIEELERKYSKHDKHFQIIFQTIQKMLNPQEKPKTKIGFGT